jgi:two-component system, OmpR family, phosphate regulon sensor histidine kinase PhoR
MHETEGHIEAIESSGAFGAPRIPTRPITWSMTAKAKPHKPSEFESVLLAIAGHDLRQPLQDIQSTHELLDRDDRATSELCQQLRSSQSAINRLRDQLDESVERAKGAEANSGAGRALVRASYFRERSCGSNERGQHSYGPDQRHDRERCAASQYCSTFGQQRRVELVSPRIRCLECSNFAHE